MIAIEMAMPDSCEKCAFREGLYDCILSSEITTNFARRPKECPLMELDHGKMMPFELVPPDGNGMSGTAMVVMHRKEED